MKKKGPVALLGSICLALMLVTLSLVSACGGTTPEPPDGNGNGNGITPIGPAPESIVIGGAIPISGVYASGGNDMKFGYEQAVRDINARGGVYVKDYDAQIPLELILIDDESEPSKTVSRMEKLASVDKVVAYTGTYSSELNAAAAGIAEKNRIPIVASAFSSITPHQQGYQYLFSPFIKTDEGLELIFKLLDTIPQAQRPTKIAVWAEKTDWGEELKLYTPEKANKYGYTVVVNEEYAETTLDYSSLILAAKSAGAEVVIAVPTPVAALSMAKQMKQLDYSPGATIFWRGGGTGLWAKNLMSDGDYASYVSNWDHNFGYPGSKDLVEVYRASVGRLPSVSVGNGYAIIQVIADAIERAGSLDRDKIRDALASTQDLMTVQGVLERFRDDGVGVTPAAIMQWHNQTSEVVYHEEFTSAPFIYPIPQWKDRER